MSIQKGNLSTRSQKDCELKIHFYIRKKTFHTSFVNYYKEIMIKMTYSIKVDGNPRTVIDIEESHKFVDVA